MARKPVALPGQAALPGIGTPAPAATIAQKVAHVKAAKQTRNHECHWPGCTEQVKPAQWGCRKHWFRLPIDIRNRIWLAYRPGQENDRRPDEKYIDAAQAAQDWIRRFGGPP